MKRRLLTVLLALAGIIGLLAGSAYWAGLQAEKSYRSFLTANSNPQFRLDSTTHRRGWWTSEAATRIDVGVTESVQITLNHTIYHGLLPLAGWRRGIALRPVQAVVRTVLASAAPWSRKLIKLYGGQEPLVILSVIGLDGATEHTVTMPPLQLAEQEEVKSLRFDGLQGQWTATPDAAAIAGHIDAPGLQLVLQDQIALLARNLRLTTAQRRQSSGLPMGDLDVSLAGLRLETPAEPGKALELESIALHGGATPQGELFDSRMRYSVAKVNFAGAAVGDGYLQLTARRLDQATLLKLQQWAQRLPSGYDSDQTRAELLSFVQGLLRFGPMLALETQIHTAQGKLQAVMDVNLQDPGPGAFEDAATLWRKLLAGATAEISIDSALLEHMLTRTIKAQLRAALTQQGGTADEAALEELARTQLQQQLAMLLQQGFLQIQDNAYKTVGAFENGRLFLNGQEIPLPPDA